MSSGSNSVRVTMVKKQLASGEPCRKCGQAEDMLRRRDLWTLVNEVVIADERDPKSPGMLLAEKHQIELAPFFLVDDGSSTRVFDSAIKLAKEVLGPLKKVTEQAKPIVETAGLEKDVVDAAKELAKARPEKIVDFALEALGDRCAIAFSGAEDVALIDMAAKAGKQFSVFCLDTGRLHAETYRFIDTVRQTYGIEIRMMSPEAAAVEELVRRKGLFSFYEDGHHECCDVRKIRSLRRALGEYDGWITGQRRDQSPTRADVPVLSWDEAHKSGGMLKANPMALWSQTDVWEYIRENDVPYNELHDQGYASIGCEPCTRASRPGEHERAARWWWEDSTKRECGLHLK